MNTTVCAPTDNQKICWAQIIWDKHRLIVKKLQMRIVKAQQEGRYNKVKSIQWILTHSISAKLLAVKRVTENKGKNTPGINRQLWKTDSDKMKGVQQLIRRGYSAEPLRRVYIPKKNSKKKRPLGIPTMKDRAMQALYLMALDPVAETICDKNSYGFRKARSTADATEQLFILLSQKTAPKWILEGDIKGCFDNISHNWLIDNIPLDKRMLSSWLKSGIVFDDEFYDTEAGTPQGGIISPCLANLALNGLESLLKDKFKATRVKGKYINPKVYTVIYADDFVVTANSKELLEEQVLPVIKDFMEVRGLKLSKEKTLITNINTGFDFLGKNVRKYDGKLLIKPSKPNIHTFLTSIREIIEKNRMMKQEDLIKILNPKLQGWANFHRHKVSKKTFSYVDSKIFEKLWWWSCRRHPKKGKRWVRKRYFHSIQTRSWIFAAKTDNGLVALKKLFDTTILRHVKIRGDANPYDSEWNSYFEEREGYRMLESMNGRNALMRMWKKQKGLCYICNRKVTEKGKWRMHKNAITKKKYIVHDICHKKIHGKIQKPVELAFL